MLSLLVMLAALLTACDGGASVYQNSPITASTPLADLPVNAALQGTAVLPTPVSEAIINAADAEYLLLTNLYERSVNAVVNIEVVSVIDRALDFSSGSGFVFDTEGHIVTNAHVVEGATEILVTFQDGYVDEAELVGADSYSDLAVIRVDTDPNRLITLPLGDSDSVKVGQRAIAIGNPFGLNGSMTVGIVSGIGRQLASAALIEGASAILFQNPSIIQVDAEINPGNSGGPLLNSKGEVIGVNTAIRTESGVFEGVGYAVPVGTIKRVVPELIRDKRVNYAWLGISAQPTEYGLGVPALAEPLNLPVNSGVLISAITPNSPAAKGGLRGGRRITTVRGNNVCVGGDIIIAIDGVYVDNIDELLYYMVVNSAPNDVVTLRVVRDQETLEIPITLEPRPQQRDATPECG